MALLRERLRPLAPSELAPQGEGDCDPLWMRYADLVKMGYSPETSLMVAESPIPVHRVTSLLIPELAAH